jgi:nucleoside-diphosphate-sugar epimerase
MIGFFKGMFPIIPSSPVPVVDVRDVAYAHVQVLDRKDLSNQRLICNNDSPSLQDIRILLSNMYPSQWITTWTIPSWIIRMMPECG